MLEKCEEQAPGLTLWADPDRPEVVTKRGIYTALNEKIRNDTRIRRIELGLKAPTSSKLESLYILTWYMILNANHKFQILLLQQ